MVTVTLIDTVSPNIGQLYRITNAFPFSTA